MSIFKGAVSPLRSELTTAGYTEASNTIPAGGDSVLLLENFSNSNLTVQIQGEGISLATGLVNQNPSVTQVDGSTFISYNKTYVKPSGLKWLEVTDAATRAGLIAATNATYAIDPNLYNVVFQSSGAVSITFQDVFQAGSIMIPLADLDFQLDQLPSTAVGQDPVLKLGSRTFTRAQVLANRYLIPGTTDRYFIPVFISCVCNGEMPNISATAVEPTFDLQNRIYMGPTDLASTAKVGWGGINTTGTQYKPSETAALGISVQMRTFKLSPFDTVVVTRGRFDAIAATYSGVSLLDPDDYTEDLSGGSAYGRVATINYKPNYNKNATHFLQIFDMSTEEYNSLVALAEQDDQVVFKYLTDVKASEIVAHTVVVNDFHYYGYPIPIADGSATHLASFDVDSDKYDTWTKVQWSMIITQTFTPFVTTATIRNATRAELLSYAYPGIGNPVTDWVAPFEPFTDKSRNVYLSDQTLIPQPLTINSYADADTLVEYNLQFPNERGINGDLPITSDGNHVLAVQLDQSVTDAIVALATTNPDQAVVTLTEEYPNNPDWTPLSYSFTAAEFVAYSKTIPLEMWSYYRDPAAVPYPDFAYTKSIAVSLDSFNSLVAHYSTKIKTNYSLGLTNPNTFDTYFTDSVGKWTLPNVLSGFTGKLILSITPVGDPLESALYNGTTYSAVIDVVNGRLSNGDTFLYMQPNMELVIWINADGTYIDVKQNTTAKYVVNIGLISATPFQDYAVPNFIVTDHNGKSSTVSFQVNSTEVPDINLYAKDLYLYINAERVADTVISCANSANGFYARTDLTGPTIEVQVDNGPWVALSDVTEINHSYMPSNPGALINLDNSSNADKRVRMRCTSGTGFELYVDPNSGLNDVEQPNQSYVLYDANGTVIDPRLEANLDYSDSSMGNPDASNDYVVKFMAVEFCLSPAPNVISCDGAPNATQYLNLDGQVTVKIDGVVMNEGMAMGQDALIQLLNSTASYGVVAEKEIVAPSYTPDDMVMLTSDQVDTVTLNLPKGTSTIYWGDDTVDTDVSGEISHTYGAKGKYTVVVRKSSNEGGTNGNNTMIMIQAMGIAEVVQWWSQGYETLGFNLSSQTLQDTLVKVPTTPPLVFSSLCQIFMRCSVFNDPNVVNWDMSQYTDLNHLFYECHKFNKPIGSWNVSGVTNMESLFYNCHAFNQDISAWNVSKVASGNMDNMFYGCTVFNKDLSQWCVTNITSEPGSFRYDSALTDPHCPVWGTCPRGENNAPLPVACNWRSEDAGISTLVANWGGAMDQNCAGVQTDFDPNTGLPTQQNVLDLIDRLNSAKAHVYLNRDATGNTYNNTTFAGTIDMSGYIAGLRNWVVTNYSDYSDNLGYTGWKPVPLHSPVANLPADMQAVVSQLDTLLADGCTSETVDVWFEINTYTNTIADGSEVTFSTFTVTLCTYSSQRSTRVAYIDTVLESCIATNSTHKGYVGYSVNINGKVAITAQEYVALAKPENIITLGTNAVSCLGLTNGGFMRDVIRW